MTENEPNATQPGIRGAIRVSLKNSTEVIVAGREFSVFVTVQNPFEVPLTVRQVRSHLPTEFSDIEQERRFIESANIEEELYELQLTASGLGVASSGLIPKTRRAHFPVLSRIKFSVPFMSVEYTNPHSGTAIARDLSEESQTISAQIKIPFLAALETKKQLKSSQLSEEARDQLKNKLKTEIDRYQEELKNAREEKEIIRILQPGNSVTKVFTFRSNRGISFSPSSYNLKIEIEYDIKGERNIDSVEHVLPVKASISTRC